MTSAHSYETSVNNYQDQRKYALLSQQEPLISHTYLNFGIVVWGSLVQLRPLANKMFKAVATARAAGVGSAGVFGTCWPLRARIGEPTHSYKQNHNNSKFSKI
jgi:hypothetical protein